MIAPPTLPPSDHRPRPYAGPSKQEVLALRRQFVNPAIFTYYKEPLMIVEGHMQYLYDETGRRYLDGFGGIVTVSVGHCHPKIVAAVNRQNEILQHTTTIYLNPCIAEYARDLAARMPGDLKVCYFTNSGSEANDLAILMARAYTGNFDVVALRNCYHGGSMQTMGLTSHHTWKFNVPHSFGVHHALFPDRLRGPYGYDDPAAGPKYAADVKNLIEFGTPGKVAAFIAESIQGVGGAVVFPDGYLKAAHHARHRPVAHVAHPLQHLRRQSRGLHAGAGGARGDRRGLHPGQRRAVRGQAQGGLRGSGPAARPHRRRPRPGIDARDRARERPCVEGAGQGRMRPGVRTLPRARPIDRQGRPQRQRPADQAADVPDGRRRRLSRRSPRRVVPQRVTHAPVGQASRLPRWHWVSR